MVKYFLELYLKPKTAWEKLAQENFTIPQLYIRLVIFFAFIPAVSHFIGFTVFREYYVSAIKKFLEMAEKDPEQPKRTVEYMKALMAELMDSDITQELFIMLVTYGFELLKPLVFTVIILFLSPAFGGIKDPQKSFTVAAFALVPSWVAGVFYVMNSPISMFMVFMGMFYTFYLIFIGGEKVLNIPSEKSKNFQFIIVVVILYLVISGVIGQVETLIMYRILGV
ncbi:Yip1 domain-containing protein [Persephonella hydrogeniphila]|uniref:Yip1 domain-containing protein n=1 Tax=Persephonella hydrogeniphila TaxID=198703 RepID=A0A285NJN7_9AQUI|nr:Yip1 family protein [Persephonella hydrogeniphila]SNZ09689.1 Yip1 domain-containing protein [Persephonella hydrogeniphila]